MQTPADIVFRNIPKSEALESAIEQRIAKLERHFPQITACNVTVEETHHHKRQGKLFHIRINLSVPDNTLVVSHEKHDKPEHEDPYIAMRDAFSAMERQLDDYAQKLRGDVKNHSRPTPPIGDDD